MRRRAARPRSRLGPLLLVLTGCSFLLVETLHVPVAVVLLWLARWWPLLLLGSGLVLLTEWMVDVRADRNGVHGRRRGLGAWGGLLLVLIVTVGLFARWLQDGAAWLHSEGISDAGAVWGIAPWLTQQSDIERELDAPLGASALLTIQNYEGAIRVTGSSLDGRVHVSVHQHVRAWHNDNLQRRKEHEQPELRPAGNGLLLSIPGSDHDAADLEVEVPHETALTIAPEQGELSVSQLRGSVNIAGHKGNVTLTALTGQVMLHADDDDSTITGHSLSGDIRVQGRSGDLAFSDVDGPLSLQGDFFGTTHLERIQGPVHFQSRFTQLACAALPGELRIEGRSELLGRELQGPVSLVTSNRSVTLTGLRQGLTLQNRNGSTTLSFNALLSPVQVTNTGGPVAVDLPRDSPFTVQAQTTNGELSNEFGFRTQENGHSTTLQGQVGQNGPLVKIQNSEGDLTLRHTGTLGRQADNSSDD